VKHTSDKGYRGQAFFGFQTALAISLATGLVGCGGSSGGSSAAKEGLSCSTLAGSYYAQNTPSETLTVSNSCTLTDSVCGYNASYTVPNQTTGATNITVNGTNGTPGCMSSTVHACVVEFNGVQLGINCDNGQHLYLYIKN
jgi:hypothetical protein